MSTSHEEALKIATDALEEVCNWRFGWDGDCGVTRRVEKALEDIAALTQSAQPSDKQVSATQQSSVAKFNELEEAERKMFEDRMTNDPRPWKHGVGRNVDGAYKNGVVEHLWSGWWLRAILYLSSLEARPQVREAVLEEAAKICEQLYADSLDSDYDIGGIECAAKLRAMQSKQPNSAEAG